MEICSTPDCGREVEHPRTGECARCYQRRYWRDKRSPKTASDFAHTYPLPTVGYYGAHRRVYAAKGRAADYQCEWPGCTSQAAEWAYKGDSDQEQTGFVRYRGRKGQSAVTQVAWSPSPDDYRPLCLPHHGAERDKWGAHD